MNDADKLENLHFLVKSAREEDTIPVIDDLRKRIVHLESKLADLMAVLLKFYEANADNESIDMWPLTELHPNHRIPGKWTEEAVTENAKRGFDVSNR